MYVANRRVAKQVDAMATDKPVYTPRRFESCPAGIFLGYEQIGTCLRAGLLKVFHGKDLGLSGAPARAGRGFLK